MDRQQPTNTTTVLRVLVVCGAVAALCLLGAGVAAAQQHGGAHGRMHTYLSSAARDPAPAASTGVTTLAATRAHRAPLAVPRAVLVAVRHGSGSGLAALVAIAGVTAFLCLLALTGRSAARDAAAGADTVTLHRRGKDEIETRHLAA